MRHHLRIALAVLLVSTAAIAAGKIVIASTVSQQAPPDPQAVPTMSASTRARLFRPGTPWRQGTIPGQMTPAEAEAFSRYPLFYLGESIGGYHLTRVQELKIDLEPNAPWYRRRTDEVSFGYGDCVRDPGNRSCPIPVGVIIKPACLVRPSDVAPEVITGKAETVRGGATMLRLGDGHIMLWTATVSISIHTSDDKDLLEQAIRQIQGFGQTKNLAPPYKNLPAPDFSGC